MSEFEVFSVSEVKVLVDFDGTDEKLADLTEDLELETQALWTRRIDALFGSNSIVKFRVEVTGKE